MTQEKLWQAHAVENSYVAVLGGPAHFGRVLWSEVVRREFPEAGDSMVLGDGATWIRNLAGEHFGSSRHMVDWYHAKDRLYQAGHQLFGESSDVAALAGAGEAPTAPAASASVAPLVRMALSQ